MAELPLQTLDIGFCILDSLQVLRAKRYNVLRDLDDSNNTRGCGEPIHRPACKRERNHGREIGRGKCSLGRPISYLIKKCGSSWSEQKATSKFLHAKSPPADAVVRDAVVRSGLRIAPKAQSASWPSCQMAADDRSKKASDTQLLLVYAMKGGVTGLEIWEPSSSRFSWC